MVSGTAEAADAALLESHVFPAGGKQAPLAVAGLGTLLLVTADMQPILPASRLFFGGTVPAMSRGWQVAIIAMLLAVAATAVIAGWRHRPAVAVLAVLVLGLAGLLINTFIFHRAVSVADLMTHRLQWYSYGSQFVLPFLACAAMIQLAIARERRFVSGVLLATGAAGYLFYFQELVFYLGIIGPHPAPGRAVFAGLLGSAVIGVAGMLARGDDAGPRPKTSYTALTITVVATIALTVAAFYGWAAYLSYPSTPSHLVIFLDAVLPTLILGVGACMAVFGRHYADRRMAAGVLVAGGLLTLAYFLDSHVFGWMIPVDQLASPPGPQTASGDIGVAAGLAFLLTGAWLAATGKATAPAAGESPAAESGTDRRPDSDAARSDTTRYLCAAAHLDNRFARQVAAKIVTDRRRAAVPSFGTDPDIVMRHCVAARRRQNVRDVFVTAALLAALPPILDLHTLAGLRDILILFLLAVTIVLADHFLVRYRIGVRQLSRATFDPARLPSLTGMEQRRLDELQGFERGSVSVYGTYSPFAGSGFLVGGWSFALNAERGKEVFGDHKRHTPTPFDTEDLYAAVRRDLEELGLAGVLVENRLMADGRLGRLVQAPNLRNRVYQCVRIQDWEGDLVLSAFINFTRRGSGLLAEVRHFVLAPVKEQYRQVDLIADRTPAKRLRAELRELPKSVLLPMVAAPVNAIAAGWRMGPLGNKDGSAARVINDADAEYNFGAMTSIRELGQSANYRKYFQQLDSDVNAKLIDRQVLDTIVAFLDEHNIDTTQFEEQRAVILNQGVVISGGEFRAGSVAVGSRSRARATIFPQRRSRRGAKAVR
jgi:hypothetical protein